jgi:hypothetical protein
MPIEEIERQIDVTRGAIDRTIRALQLELSPRHRAERAWRSAKVRTDRSMRAGVNWAVAHPVPIAIGAVAVIAAAIAIAAQSGRR